MKSKRRDWLKRQVEAGKMEARCDFYFDAHYEQDTAKREWMPVVFAEAVKDTKYNQDVMYMFPWYFTGKSGYCHEQKDGTFVLAVHSNQYYTLRYREYYAIRYKESE